MAIGLRRSERSLRRMGLSTLFGKVCSKVG
jgi:hypothetical protein